MSTMHVYYNESGDIKIISPVADDTATEYELALIPLDDVAKFLKGEANPANFLIEKITTNDKTSYIVSEKRKSKTQYIRTLDNYLKEINQLENSILRIENKTISKIVKISINPEIDYKNAELDIFKLPNLSVYFTKKGDPHILLHAEKISLFELYNSGIVEFKYETDLTNVSLYMLKLADTCSYTEKAE